MKIVIISFIFLTNFISCKQKLDLKNGQIIEIPKRMADNSNFKLSDIASKIDYVFLEQSNNNSYFSNPSKIKISNKWIVVWDNIVKKLYLFNKDGKFISNISKKGKGPGEYISIRDFNIDPNEQSVYILDFEGNITQFSMDNILIKSIKLSEKPSHFMFRNNGFLFINTRPLYITGDKYCTFFSTDKLGLIQKTFLWRNFNDRPKSIKTPKFYAFEDESCLYENNDTIYSITKDSELYSKWIFKKSQIEAIENMTDTFYRKSYGDFVMTGFREIKEFFILIGFKGRHLAVRLYNKETKELSDASAIYTNDILGYQDKSIAGFENDIDGGYPFVPNGQINNHTLFRLYNFSHFNTYYYENNFNSCKNPEKREELKKRAINNIDYVLMLVHLK